MSDDGYRPAWLDYWNAPEQLDPSWPAANPNWRKSEHQHGVGFHAPWEEPFSGFPEHARRCAVALAATGLPVHLRSSRGGMQFMAHRDLEAGKEYERLKSALAPLLHAEIKCYDAEVWQVISEREAFFRLGGERHHYLAPAELRAVQGRRVISTVFERDRVSADEAKCLGRVAQVWVANDADKQMLQGCGLPPEKVRVVPVPYFPADAHLAFQGRQRLPGPVRFYHVGKWEPRKCHHEIIGAFLLAFGPGQCKLYLKTSLSGPKLKSGYPQSPSESVHRWLADERVKARGWTLESLSRDVFLIQQRLTEQALLQMHRLGDVYVTLSRGEGFDMPAFDARLSGNVLLYTPSGGPQSFAASDDVLVPRSGSVPCDPFYGWSASYLDFELEQAAHGMVKARELIEGGPQQARRVRDLEGFTAGSVGAAMRAMVQEIIDG